MLCSSEGVPDRGPHQGAGTAASVSRQALGPLWHIKSEKMAATIRKAEAGFPTRERPKNRIRGLPIEADSGTWPSFLRTIPNFLEFFRLSTGIFLRFCWLQAQLPQNLQVIPPNFFEFLYLFRVFAGQKSRFCKISEKIPRIIRSF